MPDKLIYPCISSTACGCPNPFQLETYHGCTFNCLYCFSKDSHYYKTGFTELKKNNPKKFAKVLDFWTKSKNKKLSPSEKIFFKHRIPLLIGTKSDPFPAIEDKDHVTEDFLRVLGKYDYPVRILSKNAKMAYYVLNRLPRKQNIAVNISISSLDTDFISKLEPAFTPFERLKYIEYIQDIGYPVFVNLRPVIFDRFMEELPGIMRTLRKINVWGFTFYPLQINMLSSKKLKKRFDEKFPGLYDNYIELCRPAGFYFSLKEEYQFLMNEKVKKLAKEYDLNYISSLDCFYGKNQECCGTERLRNYNTFDYNLRAYYSGQFKESELCSCKIKGFSDIKGRGYNFNKNQTLKEYTDDRMQRYFKE